MNEKQITDALVAAQGRGLLPTSLSTAGLREKGAELLNASVFTARGTNVTFVSRLRGFLNRLAGGELGEGQTRTAIYEVLDALGYDSERGGFPGEELDPVTAGTLRDLRSFRRVDFIVKTQRALMAGAGQKLRGSSPEALRTFPAWEVGPSDAESPRIDWDARWVIAGGVPREDGRLIALKGSPVWGELGSFDNFKDALGVDHAPFYFGSTRPLIEVSAREVRELGILGPSGEEPEEFFATEPVTLSGKQPLPSPKISLAGVDPDLVARFKKLTEADGSNKGFDFEAASRRSNAARDAAIAREGERTR